MRAHSHRDLLDFLEVNLVPASGVPQNTAEGTLDILGDRFRILADLANLEAVVGSISHDEICALSGLIQLRFKTLGVKTMNLNGARVRLFRVELLSEDLWQHFVNANIRQEEIVVSQELALVLKLSKFSLQAVEADDLSDAGDVHVLNLLPKVRLWVLHNHTDASVKLA